VSRRAENGNFLESGQKILINATEQKQGEQDD